MFWGEAIYVTAAPDRFSGPPLGNIDSDDDSESYFIFFIIHS